MPLETPVYVQDLIIANPFPTDDAKQGDDHIRNLKIALDNTFPDGDRAVYFGSTPAVSTADVAVSFPADGSKIISVDATASAKVVTLPTPSGVNAKKWSVKVVKTDASVNTVTVSYAPGINGSAAFVLSLRYQAVDLVWDTEIVGYRAFPTLPNDLLPLLIGSSQVLPIAQGGSGQITAHAAFDAWHINGADIASGATVDLDAATGGFVGITGTTTITAITLAAGRERWVRALGAFTLTHGVNLVLPGGANIIAEGGDFMLFRGFAGGVVRCLHYQRLSGVPLVLYAPARAYAEYTGYTARSSLIPGDDTIPQDNEGDQILTVDMAIKRINSRVRLSYSCFAAIAENTVDVIKVALFSSLSTNALNVGEALADIDAPGALKYLCSIQVEFAPATLSTVTYQVRMGSNATYYVNGVAAGRLYGGTARANLIVEEIFI